MCIRDSIIGDVDAEKLSILKNADAIVREELDAYNERLFAETGERNSEHAVWQYFAVLPDIKSVGVMGDERTYARPVILRAVESSDAMTADWARLPYDVLARISGRIVAEVPGVNRVVYDCLLYTSFRPLSKSRLSRRRGGGPCSRCRCGPFCR